MRSPHPYPLPMPHLPGLSDERRTLIEEWISELTVSIRRKTESLERACHYGASVEFVDRRCEEELVPLEQKKE